MYSWLPSSNPSKHCLCRSRRAAEGCVALVSASGHQSHCKDGTPKLVMELTTRGIPILSDQHHLIGPAAWSDASPTFTTSDPQNAVTQARQRRVDLLGELCRPLRRHDILAAGLQAQDKMRTGLDPCRWSDHSEDRQGRQPGRRIAKILGTACM